MTDTIGFCPECQRERPLNELVKVGEGHGITSGAGFMCRSCHAAYQALGAGLGIDEAERAFDAIEAVSDLVTEHAYGRLNELIMALAIEVGEIITANTCDNAHETPEPNERHEQLASIPAYVELAKKLVEAARFAKQNDL